MLELFLAVCLKTDIDCYEVGVSYRNLMPQAWGVTTMYSNGMQHIELDPILARNPHLKAAVILHEFTHVYLNAQGKTDAGHGREFVMTCLKLSKLSGLPRLACQEKL